MQWLLTCEYEVYLEVPEDPLLARPKIQYGSNRFQTTILFDQDGNPIVNSAFDFFEESPEKDDSRNLMTIVRNEAKYDPSLTRGCRNTINNAPWFGEPKFTWKCLDVTGQMVLDSFGNNYWEVTYEYENKPETWVLKLLDVGYNSIDLTDGKRVQIRDKENHPLTAPRPLNSDGTAKNEDDLPDELEFHTYPEIDFTIFNLDSFYTLLQSLGLLPVMGAHDQPTDPVYFSRSDARRIQAMVRAFEGKVLLPDTPIKNRREVGLEIRLALTTSAITARSGATPGTGTAKFYCIKSGTGGMTARAPVLTIHILNPFGSGIATGKFVIIASIDLAWVVLSADCP